MGNDDEVVAAAAQALTHPLRVRVVRLAAAGGKLSPSEVAEAVGAPLGNVAYHVRQLHKLGVLVKAGSRPVRGAVEHYYRLADVGPLVALHAATGDLLEMDYQATRGVAA